MKVKVKFLTDNYGERTPGDEANLYPEIAEYLVKAGIAEVVEKPKAKPKPKPSPKK